MLLLAVKTGLVLMACWPGQTPLRPAEQARWKALEPSIVILMDGERRSGGAVLVDGRGYFLAHSSVVPGRAVSARTASGKLLTLQFKAEDGKSGLVILRADDWPVGAARPVPVASSPPRQGSILLGVVPSGPFRAEFVSSDRIGIIAPSRKLIDLSEVRFEAPADLVAGSLLFTDKGELLGALGATLTSAPIKPTPATGLRMGAMGGGAKALGPKEIQTGPSRMTVAFLIGTTTLERTVQGLLSPGGRVPEPTLGVFCRDSAEGGALVEQVVAGSPAQKAGIRVGDVILSIGERSVVNQIDFGQTMQRQTVGDTVQVKVRRGRLIVNLTVVVGSN